MARFPSDFLSGKGNFWKHTSGHTSHTSLKFFKQHPAKSRSPVCDQNMSISNTPFALEVFMSCLEFQVPTLQELYYTSI